MPKKFMQSEAIILNIMNENFSDWNEKNIPMFLTLLGIHEACELEQSNSTNIWFTIGVIEKIINNKCIYLPNWMANSMTCSNFLPIYQELLEIAKNNTRPIYTYPDLIELINPTSDFYFKLSMPLEMPSKNPKKWIKWCFSIKLLFYYSKNPFPMDFLASRGIFSNQLIIYPNKELAINLLIDYYQKILPKCENPILPVLPKYEPPYLEMEKREYLWSHPKRVETINLRKMVWFYVLSHIAQENEISSTSLLKGVNGMIHFYRKEKNPFFMKIIGNCLGLIFSNFKDVKM